MERRFEGKTALVTGAAGGIGRAAALAFAREGASVALTDISGPRGDTTLAAVLETGARAFFVEADVSKPDQVERLVHRTLDTFGRLDCALNNAGIPGTRARTHDRTLDEWDRVLAVNLTGTWLCMKHEIPPMLQQGSGAIVNTASVAGILGVRRFSAYSATKHAVVGLTKSAALEYGRFGLRINAVCPGLVDTDLLRTISTGAQADASVAASFVASMRHRLTKKVLAAKQPGRRIGLPEEVAEAVLWLCSDAASFVNGHALVVDGGFSVR
jgi:NAD(P)-dependent dehydrogenase (short-subunit alcohol dehydrogenase family)